MQHQLQHQITSITVETIAAHESILFKSNHTREFMKSTVRHSLCYGCPRCKLKQKVCSAVDSVSRSGYTCTHTCYSIHQLCRTRGKNGMFHIIIKNNKFILDYLNYMTIILSSILNNT
ncbi:hypothetical protein ACTFIW_008382 [Dictyostelium discoideum]